ncbi:unnamed protein product, partial [Candidula unifasciata]
GPLIDQDGPGSVFYLIRLREKKKRVQAKRGERLDRHLSLASQSPMSGLHQGFDITETQNVELRSLEDRMRQWLEVDNPKGKPQIAQLRRLQDLEMQPRPGNRVVVRRKIRRRQEDIHLSPPTSSMELDSEITEEARLAAYKILLTY